MSFGLQNGELVEVRVSAGLVDELRRWVENEAQLPTATAGTFANALCLHDALRARSAGVERALRVLGEILKRHSVKGIDAEVQAVGDRLRLAVGERRGEEERGRLGKGERGSRKRGIDRTEGA